LHPLPLVLLAPGFAEKIGAADDFSGCDLCRFEFTLLTLQMTSKIESDRVQVQ
jgi:hypothetical protein